MNTNRVGRPWMPIERIRSHNAATKYIFCYLSHGYRTGYQNGSYLHLSRLLFMLTANCFRLKVKKQLEFSTPNNQNTCKKVESLVTGTGLLGKYFRSGTGPDKTKTLVYHYSLLWFKQKDEKGNKGIFTCYLWYGNPFGKTQLVQIHISCNTK